MRLVEHASLCVLALLGSTLCGCFASFEAECGADAHCNRFPGGLCHTNPATERRWCGYPDPECPSGYRYSDLDVGDGVSGSCTAEPPARCNPTADFGEPTLVPNLNSSFDEIVMTMTRDELVAFFIRIDGPSRKLLTSMRSSRAIDFPPPALDPKLTVITAATDQILGLWVTGDGLAIYFLSYDSLNGYRFLVSVRSAREDSFGEPRTVSVGSSPLQAPLLPSISFDGQTLYWIDYYAFDLRSATRERVDAFRSPRIVSKTEVYYYVVSSDELTLYYADGFNTDVIGTTRTSMADSFGPGVPVPVVNSAQEDTPIYVTGDGCLLYLRSKRPGGIGGYDIWVARRSR